MVQSAISNQQSAISKNFHLANLNPKDYQGRQINFAKFRAAVENDYLLVLGSSELNTAHPFFPSSFFSKEFDIPSFVYGHAHFELLGSLGLLSAVEDDLTDETKLVIIVSPGWFERDNLLPQAFIEHFPDDVLEKAVYNSQTRKVFSQYISRIQNEIEPLTKEQMMLIDPPDLWSEWKYRLNKLLFSYRQRLLGREVPVELQSFDINIDIPKCEPKMDKMQVYLWKKAREDAKNWEFSDGKRMSAETGWVYKTYFDKYLGSKISNENRKIIYENPEYELIALEELAKFLHKKNIRALFVMQGLNPLFYKDMKEFDPINHKVAEILKKYDQHFLDLYFKEVKPAVLTDIMHMGNLGWVMIDEEIAKTFYLKGDE